MSFVRVYIYCALILLVAAYLVLQWRQKKRRLAQFLELPVKRQLGWKDAVLVGLLGIFALGIWSEWPAQEGDALNESCAVTTTIHGPASGIRLMPLKYWRLRYVSETGFKAVQFGPFLGYKLQKGAEVGFTK